MTNSHHSAAGKIGGNARWAMEPDRAAAMAPARAGLMRRFEDQVDPDRVLTEAERAKRVENARKAHYARMALKSAKVRRAKKELAAKRTVAKRGGVDEDRRE